jgi:hypothetical protein
MDDMLSKASVTISLISLNVLPQETLSSFAARIVFFVSSITVFTPVDWMPIEESEFVEGPNFKGKIIKIYVKKILSFFFYYFILITGGSCIV